jgi:integral membrane sensor domain MASE1
MSRRRAVLERFAALILWLTTIGLGIADIYFLRDIFFALYARFGRERWPAILFGDVIVVIAAMGLVGLAAAAVFAYGVPETLQRQRG